MFAIQSNWFSLTRATTNWQVIFFKCDCSASACCWPNSGPDMYVPAARLDCMNYLMEHSYDQQVHYMLCMNMLMPSLSPDISESSSVFCTSNCPYGGCPHQTCCVCPLKAFSIHTTQKHMGLWKNEWYLYLALCTLQHISHKGTLLWNAQAASFALIHSKFSLLNWAVIQISVYSEIVTLNLLKASEFGLLKLSFCRAGRRASGPPS